jgi:hypothetical protein
MTARSISPRLRPPPLAYSISSTRIATPHSIARRPAVVLARHSSQQADPDHDGTLTKDEYLGLAEKLFNAADADKDGALTAKDLKSKAGRALLRLIQP